MHKARLLRPRAAAAGAPVFRDWQCLSTVSARHAGPPNVLSVQSHVVHGAAGNSAAVFPMQRLGIRVWPLNTVQFSNHTQYGMWTGHVFPPDHVTEIVDGITAIGMLPDCDAVLSGYLGSEQQGQAVLEVVQRIKEVNPQSLYCCDPVMGHPEKGCIVAPGVADFFVKDAASAADIICPNTLELGILVGHKEALNLLDDVLEAANALLARGPKAVLVKHLGNAGLDPGRSFEMLLATAEGVWHVAAPLRPFDRPPVGVGDFTSGVFLALHLRGTPLVQALEHTAGAYDAVMEATFRLGAYELQHISAQDGIVQPVTRFEARKL
mmetsp:Transcript_15127/g.29193  ORF Transcript_15127/g.29193 Transcript_15127/m.29193 type:complete len:323 (+) Transcript_15127:72-1040(+)